MQSAIFNTTALDAMRHGGERPLIHVARGSFVDGRSPVVEAGARCATVHEKEATASIIVHARLGEVFKEEESGWCDCFCCFILIGRVDVVDDVFVGGGIGLDAIRLMKTFYHVDEGCAQHDIHVHVVHEVDIVEFRDPIVYNMKYSEDILV